MTHELKASDSRMTAQVAVTRKGAWRTVAADGYPDAHQITMCFCWGPGFDEAVILEFWPAEEREEYKRAACFGDGQGVWKEITHYQPIQYPAVPKVDSYTLTFTPLPESKEA